MNDHDHKSIDMCDCHCESSQCKSYGYDADSQTLAVSFKGGGVYHYSGVPPEKFAELQACESVGKFMAQHVKGKHDFRKIEKEA